MNGKSSNSVDTRIQWLILSSKIGLCLNEGNSAPSFCSQVALWFPDLFCKFYFVKNHKNAKNLRTTNAGDQNP